jgi:sn-glycerol 3-phosphate transport system ATP-binding protein
MAEVSLTKVQKVYPGGVEAVKDVNFTIRDGTICVLVGPSGCGKSTLLRMVAGLEDITSGDVKIGGERVNDLDPADRDIAMVFQNYALYPHMSVYDNMAYGLRNRGTPKDEIDARVKEAAKVLEIEPFLDRKPKALSGGQRQRVAMGRAIVRKPKAFLFDEPLSNLDAKLRITMRVEIKKLQRRLGVTSIYVTHDQLEAMTLADLLVVMSKGKVEQIGPPLSIYQKPATTFVAGFIGAPPMNLMKVYPVVDGVALLEGSGLAGGAGLPVPKEGALLGIRPEDFTLSPDGSVPDGGVSIDLTVGAVEPVGAETYLYAPLGAGPDLIVRVPGVEAPEPGTKVRAVAAPDQVHLFDSATGQRIGR